MEQYGAVDLIPALEDCLATRYHVPRHNLLLSSRHSFPVWHRFSLHHRPLPFAPGEPPKRDVIRARPPTRNATRYLQRPGEFDTAIFLDKPDKFGLERMYLISLFPVCKTNFAQAIELVAFEQYSHSLAICRLKNQSISPTSNYLHRFHRTHHHSIICTQQPTRTEPTVDDTHLSYPSPTSSCHATSLLSSVV
jgi:hypothetical protein